MGLTYLLDEDISYRVAGGLRRLGIDAIAVYELGRAGLKVPDEAQLALAAEQGRTLVTYNRSDFQHLDARWREQRRSHHGILWCSKKTFPRGSIGDLVHALEATAQQFDSLEGLCLPLTRVR